jgi:hypothetical protein
MDEQEKKFDVKNLKFSFNFCDANYQIDALQNKLLEFYIRADRRFRQAFYTNYTNDFLQYLKDKAKLGEPVHLSIMGNVRAGKSSIASTIGFIIMALYGKKFSVDYVCANSIEFLDKIQSIPTEQTTNSYFLIDEDKSYFGTGSTAKKFKLQDVANIIAKHNVSTATLCPTKFANTDSHYGLRVFGKCYKTKTCRMMLYNLQEKGSGGSLPLGMVYLPIVSALLPKEIADEYNRGYEAKKDKWINQEILGENDVMYELKKKTAENFVRDKQFLSLKKKQEKLTYVSMKLGSEWTTGEVKEILGIIGLLEQGIDVKE